MSDPAVANIFHSLGQFGQLLVETLKPQVTKVSLRRMSQV
jgi:hypothetical protein